MGERDPAGMQGANLTAWEMQAAASRIRCSPTPQARCCMRAAATSTRSLSAPTRRRERRRLQQDRHVRKGAAARDNECRSTSRCRRPRSTQLSIGSSIPIEARSPDEVTAITGRDGYGQTTTVAIAPAGTRAVNYAFDMTPARLVSGLITERGIAAADRAAIGALFPERYA